MKSETEMHKPVAQKGVVVWDFLALSWEGSMAFATATRIRIEPDHPHEHPASAASNETKTYKRRHDAAASEEQYSSNGSR